MTTSHTATTSGLPPVMVYKMGSNRPRFSLPQDAVTVEAPRVLTPAPLLREEKGRFLWCDDAALVECPPKQSRVPEAAEHVVANISEVRSEEEYLQQGGLHKGIPRNIFQKKVGLHLMSCIKQGRARAVATGAAKRSLEPMLGCITEAEAGPDFTVVEEEEKLLNSMLELDWSFLPPLTLGVIQSDNMASSATYASLHCKTDLSSQQQQQQETRAKRKRKGGSAQTAGAPSQLVSDAAPFQESSSPASSGGRGVAGPCKRVKTVTAPPPQQGKRQLPLRPRPVLPYSPHNPAALYVLPQAQGAPSLAFSGNGLLGQGAAMLQLASLQRASGPSSPVASLAPLVLVQAPVAAPPLVQARASTRAGAEAGGPGEVPRQKRGRPAYVKVTRPPAMRPLMPVCLGRPALPVAFFPPQVQAVAPSFSLAAGLPQNSYYLKQPLPSLPWQYV